MPDGVILGRCEGILPPIGTCVGWMLVAGLITRAAATSTVLDRIAKRSICRICEEHLIIISLCDLAREKGLGP